MGSSVVTEVAGGPTTKPLANTPCPRRAARLVRGGELRDRVRGERCPPQ